MSEFLLKSDTTYSHNPAYLQEEDHQLFSLSTKPKSGPVLNANEMLAAILEFEAKCKPEPQSEPAAGFLKEAQEAMELKAKLRDTPKGERTAEQIAKVFNAITGHTLTETDAWTFLLVLKLVRSRNGKYNRDDYVDLSAYSALMGECASGKI